MALPAGSAAARPGWRGEAQQDQLSATTGCAFCDIIAGKAPAQVVREWQAAIAIRPFRPVAPGHLLVIPRAHVADAGADPAVSASTMAAAAHFVADLPAANIIASKGAAATQTVYHLHLHVVPRAPGDGLPLPWAQRNDAPPPACRPHPEGTDIVTPDGTCGGTPPCPASRAEPRSPRRRSARGGAAGLAVHRLRRTAASYSGPQPPEVA